MSGTTDRTPTDTAGEQSQGTGGAANGGGQQQGGNGQTNSGGYRFRGRTNGIPVLGTHAERRDKKDQFLHFKKGLTHHVGTDFRNLGDILSLITDMEDPNLKLMKSMPKKTKYLEDMGITSGKIKQEDGTFCEGVDADVVESIEKLYSEDMKLFAGRRALLKQNIIKLYKVVWGQCTPGLQTEVKSNDRYAIESGAHNALWLLEVLKLHCACVHQRDNVYYTAFQSLKVLYTRCDRETERDLTHTSTALSRPSRRSTFRKGT